MANAKGKPQEGDIEAMTKAIGLKSLADFRRADLTSEVRQKVRLSAMDEHRLAAVAELNRAGVPLEVARALGLGAAVGSATEFASLSIDEVERVLQEEPVKRLLPGGYAIDRLQIEEWLSLPLRLAADEEAPGREEAAEATEEALARDEDPARAAEDLVLSGKELQPLFAELEQSWQRTQIALQRIVGDKSATVDSDTLRSTLADLQAALTVVTERAIPLGEDFIALDEDTAETEAVEDLDAAAAIVRLQDEIRRMEAEVETLRVVGEAWSEDAADAVASEEEAEAEPVVETEE